MGRSINRLNFSSFSIAFPLWIISSLYVCMSTVSNRQGVVLSQEIGSSQWKVHLGRHFHLHSLATAQPQLSMAKRRYDGACWTLFLSPPLSLFLRWRSQEKRQRAIGLFIFLSFRPVFWPHGKPTTLHSLNNSNFPPFPHTPHLQAS